MSPLMRRLFWALRWHEGRAVSYEALTDVLWGDDPAGGPLWPEVNIRVYVHRMRRLLPGWHFRSIKGFGYVISAAA